MNLGKAAAAAVRPRFWHALARGVVPAIEHARALADIEPRTIIDVGANKGQFSLFAAARWPEAEIIAFEPLPGPARTYRRTAGRHAHLVECALGAAPATLELHVATREDSSSLLPLGRLQRTLFSMEEAATIPVPVDRLDKALARFEVAGPVLLKIDVQGYEYEVLQGLGDAAARIDWIYAEVSFAELYVGQKLFAEIEKFASGLGFTCAGLFNEARDDGKPVQADALFVRTGAR